MAISFMTCWSGRTKAVVMAASGKIVEINFILIGVEMKMKMEERWKSSKGEMEVEVHTYRM